MFYLIILAACLVLNSLPRNSIFRVQNSFFFASTFIILLVISALRTDIGTDYVNYVRLYNDIIHDSFVNSNVEVGFYLVVTLSNYISKEPQLMFMIMSLITLTALFSTKKMRGFLGVFGVICVMYLPSFSLIRQTAAVAFVLCAILSLIEGNKKQFLLYIGIGSCFHLSVLIILPFILLKRINLNPYLGLIILVCFYFLVVKVNVAELILGNPLFRKTKYGVYSDFTMFNQPTEIGSGLGVILKIIPSVIYLLCTVCFKNNNCNRDEINIISYLNYCYVIAVMLSVQIHIFNRLVDLFMFVPVITLLYIGQLSEKNKTILRTMLIIVLMINFTLMIFKNPSSNEGGLGIYPYKTILSVG